MNYEKELIGKTVTCGGISAKIAIVYSAECYDGLWDIEFRDTKGILRNWKQEFDGGYLSDTYIARAYYDDNCRGLASDIITSDASSLEEFIWESVNRYAVVVVKNYETGVERKYTYESVMDGSDCPEIVLP